MSVKGLGTRRQAFRLPVVTLAASACILGAFILFALELVRFEESRERLATDITVAGVPVGGLRLAEAVAAWEAVYSQPIELTYQGHPIQLLPAAIGFNIKSDLMQAEIRSRVAVSSNFWGDFWNFLWRRPTAPIAIDLISEYSEARLRDFLEDVARRYDRAAGQAAFDLSTATFGAGANGIRLDLNRSIAAIEAALTRPTDRRVNLVMQDEGAKPADMNSLKQAIYAYLEARQFPAVSDDSLVSVGVIDLQDGEEMWINPDITYSAASTIKIPIMLNLFANNALAIEGETRWLAAASILCSSNSASNYVMQSTGTGANARQQLESGLRKTSDLMQQIGARNTFIYAPLFVGGTQQLFSIGNAPPPPNPQFDTVSDLWNRTTPEDMAIMLQQLYDCATYGSGLAASNPDKFTQSECQQMLELLSGNVIGRMIELGAPKGTRIAHKNGWAPSARPNNPNQLYWHNGDAGIVYTPGGNYVLVIYTWERLAPGRQIGELQVWETMEGIARIIYNYFNPNEPLVTPRTPENPLGALDCVMPNPNAPDVYQRIDFTNINSGRFEPNGCMVADACYGYPNCGVDTPPPSYCPAQR
ncbi:MAG: serine hydrolase [Anaerolineae bacterium]